MANPADLLEPTAVRYDEDFCLWAERQAALLRAGDLTALDVDNLIEEIEEMPRSDRHAIESNLLVVLKHLLKYKHQPNRRSVSWESSILEHRRRVHRYLGASPSLRGHLQSCFSDCYASARRQASVESSIVLSEFPEEPEFGLTQALDDEFWPEPASE